ncbi:MAG: DUF6663 family protein [Halobacteriales archaeon]|nr:DUF6663 family protein [Halobacteriales archaeon]
MEQTTTGQFRVLAGRDADEWLLLDTESGDPTYVARSDAPDVEVGNRIDATLTWSDGDPTLADYEVTDRTRIRFTRTDEQIFEAATRCWDDAVSEGSGMNARVTHGTDGDPNGIVYTFADQPGQQDVFAEFRDGAKPIEPLIVRAAGGRDSYHDESQGATPPFEVFVLDPDEPFVVVYIVLDPDGFLAETVLDTYFAAGSLSDRL